MKLKYLYIAVIMISLIGCEGPEKKPDAPSSTFSVSDTLMNMIAIDTAKLSTVQNELKLTGKVSFNEEEVVRVYALVSGLASEVKVSLGDYVKKGQVLAIIKSAEAAGIRNDLLNAQSNLEIAKKNLQSMEDLYKSGISSEKEYLTAQADCRKAESELTRVRDIVKINGNNATADYVIKASVSGYIVERFINPHMQIRPDNSNNLFTISDLKHVWVVANVYETDIAKVHLGDEASVTTIAYQDACFNGRIDNISTVLDPDNKTMKIRINLKNENYLLKPEMFANVIVKYNCEGKMLEVPSNALIFDKSKDFVMLFNDKHDVQVREVRVFSVVGGRTYIAEGLKPGDKVISKCQLLIYNALNES
jgi:membrane fusion protein, heavy metal efflux system